jgi:hypothetical protein
VSHLPFSSIKEFADKFEAIIVPCVGSYRALFLRERNAVPSSPQSSLKKKVIKVVTYPGRLSRRDQEEASSAEELPYLAPWPESDDRHDTHMDHSKTSQTSSRCHEPWMTAELPRLEPWYEEGRFGNAEERRNHHSLSLLPRAHLPSDRYSAQTT